MGKLDRQVSSLGTTTVELVESLSSYLLEALKKMLRKYERIILISSPQIDNFPDQQEDQNFGKR